MINALVVSASATAGNSGGTYSFVVPSALIAAQGTTKSPALISFLRAPQVPIRIKTSAHKLTSSSMAIAAEGQPTPVETAEIGIPLYLPV